MAWVTRAVEDAPRNVIIVPLPLKGLVETSGISTSFANSGAGSVPATSRPAEAIEAAVRNLRLVNMATPSFET
jgi:hypothetical protein